MITEKQWEMGWCEEGQTYCSAAETQYKYRWHKLKENPSDLPSVDVGEVMFVDKYGHYYIAKPIEGLGQMKGKRFWYTSQFVAWRYIEPFEVEEC